MEGIDFVNLMAVALIALVAPLLVSLAPGLRVPAVVAEVVAGIVLGPSGLGWVRVDGPVEVLSLLGFSFLLFLAGLDTDVHRLRGAILRSALTGYVLSLALGVGAGYAFGSVGWVNSPLLVGIALAATSSGLVVALLADAGHTGDDLGQSVIAAVAVAEFAAVLALSLAFPSSGGSTAGRVVLLVSFGVLVVAVAAAIRFAAASARLRVLLAELQDTSAEIRVRASVLLLTGFAALAARFGLESVLGAFLAGAVVGVVDRDGMSHPRFRVKLEAIGNGFLIPVFFVSSGLRLDLRDLFHSPSAALRVAVFLAALLAVRGLPALVYRRSFGSRAAAAIGLLQATSLPVIVSATQIGVQAGLITQLNAVALTCAGVLSVLLFPSTAVRLLGAARPVRGTASRSENRSTAADANAGPGRKAPEADRHGGPSDAPMSCQG